MYRLWWLSEHLSDPDAPADPKIVGALMASLICSILINWTFWSTSIKFLMEAFKWLMDDSPLILGWMTMYWPGF